MISYYIEYHMSQYKWITNHVATAFQTTNSNTFTYTVSPSLPISDIPDLMVIRQISLCSSLSALTGGTTAVFAYDLKCSAGGNFSIGNIVMPYNYENNATGNVSALSFVSNPQTHIKISQPVGTNITFTLITPPNGTALPATYYISIAFDFIKFK